MNKILKYATSVLIITALMTSSVFAKNNNTKANNTKTTSTKTTNTKIVVNSLDVMVNDERVDCDNLVYKNVTYLPLRAVAESIGMEVAYNADTQQINLKRGGARKIKVKNHKGTTTTKNINVQLDSLEVNVDGQNVESSNIVYNGVTYLPLRAVAEATGTEVVYDAAKKVVYLYTADYTGEKVVVNNNADKTTTSSAVTVTETTTTTTDATTTATTKTDETTKDQTKNTGTGNSGNKKNNNNNNSTGKGKK